MKESKIFDKFLRVFVQSKQKFEQCASLVAELNAELGTALDCVQVANRYDIWGTDDLNGVKHFLHEAPLDDFFVDVLPILDSKKHGTLVVQNIEGSYDQRADATEQGIELALGQEVVVKCAEVYIFDGLRQGDIELIADYLINPIEKVVGSMELPKLLDMQHTPKAVREIERFDKLDACGLVDMGTDLGLGLNIDDLRLIQIYFAKQGRNPFDLELKIIDTYWSDHCRHTTFNTSLQKTVVQPSKQNQYDEMIESALLQHLDRVRLFYGDKHNQPLTLMQIATIGAKLASKQGRLPDLDISDENNACSFIVPIQTNEGKEDYLIQFKNETHNHPTEIEPMGGAATCLGGAIRDPLAGRAFVYQAMRVTGSGDPTEPISSTLKGKLPQIAITTGAAAGFCGYGNQIGLATGEVKEYYHSGYIAKRMEVGAVIGVVKKSIIRREQPTCGDCIMLIGGRTGIDGVGGATGSSREQTQQSMAISNTEVQKGNPVEGRKLQTLFLRADFVRHIKKCNDCGAGGVSVAIGEICDSVSIDLDAIRVKYKGMSAVELALSESQERMVVVVDKTVVQQVVDICIQENVECTHVATVVDDMHMTMTHGGRVVARLGREFLDNAGAKRVATYQYCVPCKKYSDSVLQKHKNTDWARLFRGVLSDLNVCSQQQLAERFDSTVGGNTVLMPYGGLHQATPLQGMVALIPARGNNTVVSVMTHGFDPHLSAWSPYHGGHYAVVSAIAKAVVLGIYYSTIKFSLQEYFESMTDSTTWGKPLSSLLGATNTMSQLGLVAIGGKDSMSGTYQETLSVPPTLIAFGVGIGKAQDTISHEFKKVDSTVMLLKLQQDQFDCVDLVALRECYIQLHQQILRGKVLAAYAVGSGGLVEAVSKMAFGNGLGFEFLVDPSLATQYGDIVLEVDSSFEWASLDGVLSLAIGYTRAKPEFRFASDMSQGLPLSTLYSWYNGTLASVFGQGADTISLDQDCDKFGLGDRQFDDKRIPLYERVQYSYLPKVTIAVFPGTNGEFDMQRAWENAGASTRFAKLNNKTELNQSIDNLVEAVEDCDILAIPGGFSFGDEPDGAAKSIVAVLKNTKIKKAVEALIARKGLVLGICNGFQALLKSGLIGYDKVCDLSQDDVTLTHNAIGRHISRFAFVNCQNTDSPWGTQFGYDNIFAVPVSHGEGRIVGSVDKIQEFVQSGRVFSYFIDTNGQKASQYPFNPNGSALGIEGLLSPSKQILGKMGHSERISNSAIIAKNIPIDKDTSLFESAVKWVVDMKMKNEN